MGLGWLNDAVIGDTASVSPPCCLCHQLSPKTGLLCSHKTGQDFCPAVERIPPSAVECESFHCVWDGPGTPCVGSTAFLPTALSTIPSVLQGLAHALAPPWPPGPTPLLAPCMNCLLSPSSPSHRLPAACFCAVVPNCQIHLFLYSLACDCLPSSRVLTNKELCLPLHCSSECGSGTSLEVTCSFR